MRLLIVGQAGQPTGIARVTQAIAKTQAEYFETHLLGIDYHGKCTTVNAPNPYRLHPNPNPVDVFAEDRITTLVAEIEPQIMLLYGDPWVIAWFASAVKQSGRQPLLVGYAPIDTQTTEPLDVALEALDCIVTFTQFGRKVVEACAQLNANAQKKLFCDIAVIPHGLALSQFFVLDNDPEQQRLLARKRLFPNQPELWRGFWVLNANRNQPRKRIDLTLEGFAHFAQDMPPDTRLFLHMEPDNFGLDVRRMARSLGIADRLILRTQTGHPSVSSEMLNVIYNACDVGVNTAVGEGWGLVSWEHAATGAPQILPDHSACAELWQDSALILPVHTEPSVHNLMVSGNQISSVQLGDALKKLMSDRHLYNKYRLSGLQKTQQTIYSWEKIGLQWQNLFEKLIAEKGVGINYEPVY